MFKDSDGKVSQRRVGAFICLCVAILITVVAIIWKLNLIAYVMAFLGASGVGQISTSLSEMLPDPPQYTPRPPQGG